jgi:hypothetical protein
MMAIDKIYEMVNRESGASIKCSEKYLIQWVARGFEVESFVIDEPPKEEPIRAGFITNSKATERFPHLSSNNIEYFSGINPAEQEAVNDPTGHNKRKGL